MHTEGLDAEGYIAREGSLSRVQPEFTAVVDHARTLIADTFDDTRTHSAYLYGSIPRGTATPGTSDLDLLIALHGEPSDHDQLVADTLASDLDTAFGQINGAGIELASTSKLLSDLERYDLGWFVACLCTPLLDDDLADQLPRYRPTALLARETNEDLDQALQRWRHQRSAELTDPQYRRLSRTAARKIVRTGLTLVMPLWGGWTSDLDRSAEIFGHYYPDRAQQMRLVASIARTPATDSTLLDLIIDDLAVWLATEYQAVHGVKTPRTWTSPTQPRPATDTGQ
ncbi:nucleotidyltransferase domain-containing protein [Nocardia gipuzkoensis]|uniref:nucleotidyltransferase domain-containing protein n=1 Tax=Nocardia gipuzkoensis TaxID=2749991 RepID=UPI00237D771B|nr:nucleotidyltransferase domain-containing protein [Nocardia gipuzkoensis]MDE1674947.1 nucleotidyltransferase domain-containing protein [Nocardia gipuzkoensis]